MHRKSSLGLICQFLWAVTFLLPCINTHEFSLIIVALKIAAILVISRINRALTQMERGVKTTLSATGKCWGIWWFEKGFLYINLREAAANTDVIQHKAMAPIHCADHFGFFCSSKLNMSRTVLWLADREQLMPVLLNSSFSPARNCLWPVLTSEPCPCTGQKRVTGCCDAGTHLTAFIVHFQCLDISGDNWFY